MSPKTKTFLERGFSTVVLLGLLGGAVAWNEPLAYAVLICLFCNLTSIEWFNMLRERRDETNRPLALIAGLLYPWLMAAVSRACMQSDFCSYYTYSHTITGVALIFLIVYALIAFFCELFRMDYRGRSGAQALASMGSTLLAFIYPVWLFCFSFFFLYSGQSIMLLLWLILFTKMSDIFAYCSGVLLGGKIFGERRFSPVVSPKKTWEGICGSFIITLAAGCALAYAMIPSFISNAQECCYMLILEAVLFVLAVAGDLAGSLIKRGLAVKDSGSLLPGIGGIFDLIDSPAFTVSALCVFSALMGLLFL